MNKGIYKGAPHYWYQHSLVPRERYYYGYYGMYGPWTDKSKYKPIVEGDYPLQENFGCGCSVKNWILILFVIIALYLLFGK